MHGRGLKIVITESHSGGCGQVATDLAEAGHTVVRCHETPGAEAEDPCVAWALGGDVHCSPRTSTSLWTCAR
jgi:hypothetical protein